MTLKIKKARRISTPIKMALQGVSGCGKTYSALLVAHGLCSDWNKIAVIDSENRSAALYEHLGSYNIVELTPPFTPERYTEAIRLCEQEGMEVIIIDGISQAWDYLLEYHSSLTGNSFTNWTKVTPRHNQFISSILHSPLHVICTIRTKQDYVLTEKNGKQVPEKIGLKPIQREGLDYEFTIVFDLSLDHKATISKDRTGLFVNEPIDVLRTDDGIRLLNWCTSGTPATQQDVQDRIETATTIPDLLNLYNAFPEYQQSLQAMFESKKRLIKQTLTITGSPDPVN